MQLARGAAVSGVAHAPHSLLRIPGRTIHAASLVGEDALGVTVAALVAVIRADSALAGDTVVASEAGAGSRLAVAGSLIRALDPGVEVVGVHYRANPSKVFGASSQRAIRARPFGFTTEPNVAVTIDVVFAIAMTIALILARSLLTNSSLVINNFPPIFCFIGGLGGW